MCYSNIRIWKTANLINFGGRENGNIKIYEWIACIECKSNSPDGVYNGVISVP